MAAAAPPWTTVYPPGSTLAQRSIEHPASETAARARAIIATTMAIFFLLLVIRSTSHYLGIPYLARLLL
jgi:hypothetical protein